MTKTMIAAIALAGLVPAMPAAAKEHRLTIEHRGQPVSVTYRGDVQVAHQQVGAVTPGGRPSTLRCAWRADVTVHREARARAGAVASRVIPAGDPITGSRPGWCSAQREAIAQEVAARDGAIRDRVQAVAARDRETLVAELDVAHDRRGG